MPSPSDLPLSGFHLPVLDAHGEPSTTGSGSADPAGHAGAVRASEIDLAALERALAERVTGEVRFDAGSRGAYSTDASNYRQVPLGVVVPRSKADVVATVEVCRRFGAPITSRGGGTSLAGQCTNVAVVIDFSKYLNRVLEIDPEQRLARVEPGCVLDTLRDACEEHGLTFGPDPATHTHNTLGGMIGNNSCGIHSVMAAFYGPGARTEDNVAELEVLTYDGLRLRVGPTSDEEVERIIAEGGRKAELYEQLRDLGRRHAEAIRTKYPDIPRRVSGYNLPQLLPGADFDLAKALVGTEGTCAVVLEATVKLIERKPARTLVVLGFPDVATAGDHVPSIMAHYEPVGLEGMDDKLVGYMKKKGLHPEDVELLPDGGGWLLVEFGGDTEAEADRQARPFADDFRGRDGVSVKVFEDKWEEDKLWQVRESGLGATAHVPGMAEAHPGWEDAAVPPDRVGDYLRAFRRLLDDFGYDCALYGHFGQGCIHCRITFDFRTAEGVRRYLAFIDQAADLVVEHGGSLSGEHGDGQSRAALLPKMYGDELVAAFRAFKRAWDPDGKLNPGKVVAPYLPDENLRAGPSYEPLDVSTYFTYAPDDGSFHKAANRCVGVGKCRRHGGGVMCPSYMVTREEEHSTRGRARLLFEMLQGDIVDDGWRSDDVREALDLCLACKGCKHECPVNVDMATYKAEFLAHYHKGRLRPRTAYGMGLIYWWARLASTMPALVNVVTQTEPLATAFKALGGVAQERRVPRFADQPFTAWFRARQRLRDPRGDGMPHGFDPEEIARGTLRHAAGVGGDGASPLRYADVPRYQDETFEQPKVGDVQSEGSTTSLNPHARRARSDTKRVLLWPDTFNNYFFPETAQAAVEVLEAAGFEVEIPPRPLCCGRPLYDWGFLDQAQRLWRQTIGVLRPWIRAGIPVVGLEPSCVAAFRDELLGLFPHDPDAQRLSGQTYLLSEFLEQEQFRPPTLAREAVVHGHCHHKAVMHMDAEVAQLQHLGLDFDGVLDAGCCGMAGAFGFEAEHYDVSIACGERVLLPAVRAADDDMLLIANGFSCREQIEQQTGRRALHLAEVIRLALREARPAPARRTPDRLATGDTLRRSALVAGAAALAGVAWGLLRR